MTLVSPIANNIRIFGIIVSIIRPVIIFIPTVSIIRILLNRSAVRTRRLNTMIWCISIITSSVLIVVLHV